MKKILIFAFAVMGLFACDNSDNEKTEILSGTYKLNRVEGSKVRLFTAEGEVFDEKKIEDFTKKYNPTQFEGDLDFVPNWMKDLSVEFLSESEVKFSLEGGTTKMKVIQSDGIFYLEDESISTRLNSSSNFSSDKILKYHPLYSKDIAIPLTSGYHSNTEYKQCFYIAKGDEQFKYPVLTFEYLSNRGGAGRKVEMGYYWNNEFEISGVTQLQAGDTLAVQQKYVILEK